MSDLRPISPPDRIVVRGSDYLGTVVEVQPATAARVALYRVALDDRSETVLLGASEIQLISRESGL